MDFKIKNGARALAILFSPVAIAQVSPAVTASAVADCASCPVQPLQVHIPPDPYLVATVAIVAVVAFLVGLAVGWYASTRVVVGRSER